MRKLKQPYISYGTTNFCHGAQGQKAGVSMSTWKYLLHKLKIITVYGEKAASFSVQN